MDAQIVRPYNRYTSSEEIEQSLGGDLRVFSEERKNSSELLFLGSVENIRLLRGVS